MNAMQPARIGLALAASGLLAGLACLPAAELRTSAGDRPIHRTVALARQSHVDAQPTSPPTQGVESWAATSAGCNCHACTTGCSPCGATSCGIAASCGIGACCLPTYGYWVDIDFLLGWRSGTRFPPLATSAPNGTPSAAAGVLGQPTTTIIYPTEPVGEEARPGGRIALGAWLDPAHCWGVEGRYFALADERTRFDVTSNGDPILARPIFDTVTGAPAALLVAFPGLVSPGNIFVETESSILGGDALLRRALCRWGCGRMDLLIGYQFARIDETLIASNRLTDIDPNNLIPDGTTLFNSDSFVTRSEYHAFTIGAAAQYERGAWRLDVAGKIGLGSMSQKVTISGLSEIDNPPLGTPDFVTQEGLLAQGANLGSFSRDEFSVSPEINVKLLYHVTRRLDVSAGYTLVYWSHVAHAGLQVDPNLNVPTTSFSIRDDEAWVHALTLGVACQF